MGCAPGPDGVFDFTPDGRGIVDFDGDGVNDHCDIDRDADGVPDRPTDGSAPDNCPFGDGDNVFEPGVDDDPDQRDSGGAPDGDLCDPLCPPTCPPPPGGGGGGGPGAPPFAPGFSIDLVAGLGACIGQGDGICDLLAFLDCKGAAWDECWIPDRFQTLAVADRFGQVMLAVSPEVLGLSGGVASNVAIVPDLDGDGLEDIAIAAPSAKVCEGGPSCVVWVPGRVGLISSASFKPIAILDGPSDLAGFGAGLAANGDALAVGAPGAHGGAGAVFLYRVGQGGLELRLTIVGEVGDAFGTHIAPAFGAGTADPSFLVGAPGARFGSGSLAILDASRGISETFVGPIPGGRMSRGVVVPTRRGRSVVGAVPDAFSGRGALAFFTGRGPARVRRGTPGADLGQSLVALERGGSTQVVAAAPGGAGALVTFDAQGNLRSTTLWYGSRFGTGVSSPGDLDGDGDFDLLAGYALDPAGAQMRALPIYELTP